MWTIPDGIHFFSSQKQESSICIHKSRSNLENKKISTRDILSKNIISTIFVLGYAEIDLSYFPCNT